MKISVGKTEIAAVGKGEIVTGKIEIAFKSKLKLQWHFWAIPVSWHIECWNKPLKLGTENIRICVIDKDQPLW